MQQLESQIAHFSDILVFIVKNILLIFRAIFFLNSLIYVYLFIDIKQKYKMQTFWHMNNDNILLIVWCFVLIL